jgi:hypothetical protein
MGSRLTIKTVSLGKGIKCCNLYAVYAGVLRVKMYDMLLLMMMFYV